MTDTKIDWRMLEDDGYRTVVIATPDLQGRLVGRRVPVERFAGVVERGVDICTCVYAWDLEQGLDLIGRNVFQLCSMHNGVPDVTLKPDLETLRPAAWLDGVAICLADPYEHATDSPALISPRVLLQQELARFADLGLTPLVATELEFYLFRNDPRELRANGFRGLDPTTLIPADFMIHEGDVYEPFFQRLRADLRASGIAMEAAQSEWGTGQWEMTFVYGDPLDIADRHALYKLAVRDSATREGMSATFMARPLNGQPGSSCHVHLSLRRDGKPVFWDEDAADHCSTTMRHAIAGALQSSPDLMAWYSPTINSWRRTNSEEVAGSGRTWGFDNRTTSIRVVGESPDSLRFEFRLPGADANPYLVLAGLLASVRRGLEEEAQLAPAVTGSAYELPADEVMPRDLAEATRRFARSPLVGSILPPDLVDHHRILLEHEWTTFLSAVSDWDLQRYFDRV